MTKKVTTEEPVATKSVDELAFEIERSETEVIRGLKREYKGSHYIDIRLFFKGKDGLWYPTKKGLTFTREKIGEFAEEVAKLS